MFGAMQISEAAWWRSVSCTQFRVLSHFTPHLVPSQRVTQQISWNSLQIGALKRSDEWSVSDCGRAW